MTQTLQVVSEKQTEEVLNDQIGILSEQEIIEVSIQNKPDVNKPNCN